MSTDALNLDLLFARARTGQLPLEAVISTAEQLQQAHRADDAAQLYRAWLDHTSSPAACVAQFNLGVLLAAGGDLDGADAAYRRAHELNPRLHQAQINAGLIAERRGRFADAIASWLDVAAVSAGTPDGVQFATIALNHIGRLEESRRQFAAAEAALTQSLRLNPHQPDAIQHWVHLRQKQCTWPVYTPPPGLTVNALMGATSPLAMLALLDDPAMQWLAAQSFVARKYTLPEERLARTGARAPGPLRIGYLSGDLCTHAVGLLMAELLEAHDRTRVQLTAFDFSPEDGTAHRARLRAAFDEMVNIRAMDDRAAAEAVCDRHIDVLIDMHGLSSGARPGILALRPARFIGTYLGFIGTTALPWVDFVVADPWTLPDSLAPFMTERAFHIDGSLIPLHHEDVPTGRLTRASVGLPDDAVVLASFNNIYKITPGLFACWLRILRRAPRAVLWILDDNPWATAALRRHAASAGIDPARVICAGRATHVEYRERLTLADLYLDTFPYNAGSTARDVLDACLPMVTISGRTMVSRMAGGLLHAAGLDSLITANVEGYEARILQLIEHPEEITALKADMRARAASWRDAPARWVRSFEERLIALVATTDPTPPSDPR